METVTNNANFYVGTVTEIESLRSFPKKDGGTGTEQGFWISADLGNGFHSAKHFIVRDAKVSIPTPNPSYICKFFFDLQSTKWNDKVFDKCSCWKIEPLTQFDTAQTVVAEEGTDDLPY